MSGEDNFVVEGEVTDVLPGAKFKVKFPNNHSITAHLSGKLRQNYIKILSGDKVTVEMTKYDLSQGRIVYRGKKKCQLPQRK